MKHRDLLKKIREAATAAGIAFEEVPNSGRGNHEKWRCGSIPVIIPRHREIAEGTAEGIMKDLEEELGKRWWR